MQAREKVQQALQKYLQRLEEDDRVELEKYKMDLNSVYVTLWCNMPQSQVHWDIPDTYWAWLAGYVNRTEMNPMDTICYQCLY